MAEDLCSSHKNVFIIRPPKASPLLSRMIILVFAAACGVFIFSICLKQISSQAKSFIQVIQRPCGNHGVNPLRAPHLHYPKPQSFGRAECEGNPVRFFSIVTLDRVYNLDWVSSASKNECSAAIGLKWMLNQGLMEYHDEISEHLKRKGVSVIFLFRRNLLRRMISVVANSYDCYAKPLNGTHKSHVHSQEEADTLSKYKPFINATTLISELQKMELMTAKALKYFNSTRHIVLHYEDLVSNHTKLLDVQDFLGLPHMKLKSRQVKIHKGRLQEHIQNWDEVSKTLNGTSYESFLHMDY
ncbi:hypothetical protein Nepgr_016614 [Nepenthes gracilis]|uniref:Sulfotransferase n=1 Tax=Nepenthes gracilis TaxID=150966 RepID=A0AAD3XRS2_NEPGR|nr:hypothetical protein Nepgr_016614 [Nepenthes gracilis]